jgi:hypothetical protein
MRCIVFLLVLCLTNAMAAAQAAKRPPTEKSASEIKAIEERVDYWRATCLQDWDAATHMTKAEWRTTCERVAAERRTFLLQDADTLTMDSKNRQR